MSAVFAVYSRHPINEEAFDETLVRAGGVVVEASDDRSLREGHIDDDGDASTPIFLCRDPMSELYDDEDQDLFDALGGKPISKIEIRPGKWSEKPLIRYLIALADDLDYVVTNFDNVLMRGSEIKEKQGFD